MATQQPIAAVDSETWIARCECGDDSGPVNACAAAGRGLGTGAFWHRINANGNIVASANKP